MMFGLLSLACSLPTYSVSSPSNVSVYGVAGDRFQINITFQYAAASVASLRNANLSARDSAGEVGRASQGASDVLIYFARNNGLIGLNFTGDGAVSVAVTRNMSINGSYFSCRASNSSLDDEINTHMHARYEYALFGFLIAMSFAMVFLAVCLKRCKADNEGKESQKRVALLAAEPPIGGPAAPIQHCCQPQIYGQPQMYAQPQIYVIPYPYAQNDQGQAFPYPTPFVQYP